jgi:hypothetical protein
MRTKLIGYQTIVQSPKRSRPNMFAQEDTPAYENRTA